MRKTEHRVYERTWLGRAAKQRASSDPPHRLIVARVFQEATVRLMETDFMLNFRDCIVNCTARQNSLGTAVPQAAALNRSRVPGVWSDRVCPGLFHSVPRTVKTGHGAARTTS